MLATSLIKDGDDGDGSVGGCATFAFILPALLYEARAVACNVACTRKKRTESLLSLRDIFFYRVFSNDLTVRKGIWRSLTRSQFIIQLISMDFS